MKFNSFCIVLLNLIVITTCEMRKSWKKSAEFTPSSVNLNPFDKEVQNTINSYPNMARKTKFRSTYIGTKSTTEESTTTEQKLPETTELPQNNDEQAKIEDMEEFFEEVSNEVLPEKKSKKTKHPEVQHFNIGPLMNLTIEEAENVVKVKLNETVMREIFEGTF